MKPFVRITALVLGILFLIGAAVAWLELLKYGDWLSGPGLKQAAGWLLTGLMFLALGLRGWRSRVRHSRRWRPRGAAVDPRAHGGARSGSAVLD